MHSYYGFFGFINCVLLYDNNNARMLVTIGVHFKQHFDIRYFTFCNLLPPKMFLSLDLLSENQIQHGTIGLLYVTSRYSTRTFYRRVSGFANDCLCGVWCRELTTCLLYVGPPFGNRFLNSWAVGFDIMDFKCTLSTWYFDICNCIRLKTSDDFFCFIFTS